MDETGYISSEKIDYEDYLSQISKFQDRNYDLGPTASRILFYFILRPYLSTYQIFSFLRMTLSNRMAYKNVHEIVKKLHSLELIELVGKKLLKKERDSLHNPIYYKLTTGGIFHLIYKDQISLMTSDIGRIKKFFQNYSENIVFRTILYPYFDEQSLSRMDNSIIIEGILDYLNKCCAITNTYIDFIKNNKWDAQ